MTKKLTTEEFKTKLNNKYGNEYSVLGEYEGYDKKIKIKHNSCGYEYFVSPNKILTSNRKCPKCFSKLNRTRTTKNFKEEIISLEKGNEYEILGEYKNYNTPILIRHNCGHEYSVSPSNFIAGYRCPKCAIGKHDSKAEKEILNYIKSIYVKEIIENDKNILNGKELDIYIPDIKLAIEYNGYYFHNIDHKDQYYHLNKYNLCKEQGITLITIWEDEYLKDKKKYYTIIKQFINNEDIDYNLKYNGDFLYINKDYENLGDSIYDDETNINYEYIGDTLPELINRNNNECWNAGWKIYKKIIEE